MLAWWTLSLNVVGKETTNSWATWEEEEDIDEKKKSEPWHIFDSCASGNGKVRRVSAMVISAIAPHIRIDQ